MASQFSRFISSSQETIHQQLTSLVARHAEHPFQKPITDYNRRAFEESMTVWQQAGCAPLILDTGCGVGLSTYHLAQQYPDHFVIGIDQSEDRLSRQTQWTDIVPSNMTFIRADLVDYWRLLLEAKIFPVKHFFFYPNPWPKIGHVSRRWHGHAVFPTIVALGGYIECRSNWKIYIDEFASALTQLTNIPVATEAYLPDPDNCMTPFEKKYLMSGHSLWRCQIQQLHTID